MRKLFKHIGMICLALAVAIGSFFVPVTKKQSNNFASANSSLNSITFEGSDIYIPVKRGTRQQDIILDYLLLKFNFTINRLTGNLEFNFNGSTGFFVQNQYNYNGSTFNFNVVSSSTYNSSEFSEIDLDLIFNRSLVSYHGFVYYYNSSTLFNMAVLGSEDIINSDIFAVELGFVENVDTNFPYPCNFVRYYDANGNFITFYIVTLNVGDTNRLDNRFYYFDNALNLTDNQLYNQGYQKGLADNQQNIFNNAYNAGFDDGFSDGKSEGIVEANDYSFISLFGGLFDAPVAMLMGLLNFEFLGINLWAFVTSLFTLALVLFIIKLIMGR